MSDKPKPVFFLFDPNKMSATEIATEIRLTAIRCHLTDEEKAALERLIGEHGKKHVVDNWTALESQVRSV